MQNNPGVDASSSHRAGRKMFYRPKEAREVLGIGTTTLYALMKQGKLQRRKIGGATVIPASSIEAYAAEIEAQAA